MARQCRCFALLKYRWRRLKQVDASDMELLVEMVMACCILHNLWLLSSDGADMLSDEDNQEWPAAEEDGAINNEERAAKTKRNNIHAHLLGLPWIKETIYDTILLGY